jgi:uncharacterized membrane protein YebE (DUF533 family)
VGVSPQTFAQKSTDGSTKSELTGTRKQVATIIFSGLAGALLGLSTLSFYGRPQEHLKNIGIGAAVGIISGTVYTTYKAATAPYDAYDLGQVPVGPLLPTHQMDRLALGESRVPIARYEWRF